MSSFGSFPSMGPYVSSEHSEYSRQQRECVRAGVGDDQSGSGGRGASTLVGSRGLASSAGIVDSMRPVGK